MKPKCLVALALSLAVSSFGPPALAWEYAPQPITPDVTEAPYFRVLDRDPSVAALPLREVAIDVEISGVVAEVTMTQIWENTGAVPMDATWVFPLSTRAAVHALEMQVGSRRISALIKEKQEARAIFEAARQAGQRATLLEQSRPNIFTSEVANLQPGDVIVVEVRYVELLRPTDGVYSLVVPRVVGPRYVSAAEAYPDLPWSVMARSDAPRPEPELSGWPISVTLRGGVPVAWVESRTHAIEVERTPGEDRVEVALAEAEPDTGRDFVLDYALGGDALETGVLVAPDADGEGGHFLALIEPPDRVDPALIPRRDYVFIVDTSGSMGGWPLETATAMVSSIVDDLDARDRVNVLCFSGGAEILSPRSLPATAATKQAARAFLGRQRGAGGTELLGALQVAFSTPPEPGLARTFVVVTDGMISVEKEALDLIRKSVGDANVFAFGVGDHVNRHLIEVVAKAGQGEAYLAESDAAARDLAERFLDDARAPLLTDLVLSVDGELVVSDLEPLALPTLYASRPVLVTGRYTGRPVGALVLSGNTGAGPWSARVALSGAEANPAVPVLWARERIARLSDFANHHETDVNQAEVTKLGLDYHLVTAFTSFVAVDSEDPRVSATQAADLPALAVEEGFVLGVGSGGLGFVGGGAGGLGLSGDGVGGGGGIGGGQAMGGEGVGLKGLGALPEPPPTSSLQTSLEVVFQKTGKGATPFLKALMKRYLGALGLCLESAGITAAARFVWRLVPGPGPTRVTLTSSTLPAVAAQCAERVLRRTRFPTSTPELRLELDVRP